ncbi:MAG: GNAT family N-acetyltransferase, partial [Thermoanaerobaculia bacterium]
DSAAVADLATQLGYPTTPEEAEARLRDLEERPESSVLVAEAGGVVIGWIQVAGAYRVDSEPYAEIAALVVDAAHRGGGIGAELVAAADGWAVRHGFRTLRVRSNVVRERTHAFYERLGFTRMKSQVVFTRSTARPISRR